MEPIQKPDAQSPRKSGLSVAQKISLLIVGLVIASTSLVAYLAVADFHKHLIDEQYRLLRADSKLVQRELKSAVNQLEGRARYLADTPPISGIQRAQASGGLDPEDNSTIEQWYRRLETIFISILRVDPNLHVIQLVAVADGQELVRVERQQVKIQRVGAEGLGVLSWQTLELPENLLEENAVRFSSIRLLRRDGALIEPATPVMTAALPIMDNKGHAFAVLILQQGVAELFQEVAAPVIAEATSELYLADAQGNFLFHPEGDRAFAFERGRRALIQEEFEGLKEEFNQLGGTGVEGVYQHDGQKDVFGIVRVPLDRHQDIQMIVALSKSWSHINHLRDKIVQELILVVLLVVSIAVILGLWLSRSLTLPLKNLTVAASEFARGSLPRIINNAPGELGILAASFNSMMQRIKQNTERLEREVAYRQCVEERLKQNVNLLEQFYDLVSEEEWSLKDKAQKLLALGMDSLGFSLGSIYRCFDSGEFEQRYHVGLDPKDIPCVMAGCDRVAFQRRIVMFSEEHPSASGENSYFIGAPIMIGHRLSGVVAFASQSEEDLLGREAHSFVQLLAEWLGGEIQRIETERELQEAELQQREILDNMLDGVITIDDRGLIVSFNRFAAKMFGYESEEVVGRNINMLMPEPYHSSHDQYLKNYLGGGQPKIIGIGREVVAKRKDGSLFPIELAVAEAPVSGQRRFVGVLRDISARKRSEEQLRLQSAALESAANAVVITDVEGRIIWVNEAFSEFTGYERDKVIGSNPRILKSGHHDNDFYKTLWDTVLSGEVWQGEIVNRRKDGSHYSEEQTITPVENEAGEITHFVAIKQDITERKKIERMKSEFVSTVSHELRTPLTSIRGSLGLLTGGVAGDLSDQARKLIEIACNNSDRLVRLINDILDMEKIESGKMQFGLRPIDLAPLVRDAVAANEGFAREHKVSIVEQNELDRARVLADPDRLTQVITNLVSNAAKFSPDGGAIQLRVQAHAKGVRISVIDQGPGIPKEFQGRIFAKFSQADSSDTRQKGGTGLGLSISKAIVEKLNGEISFTTKAGEGTEFHVDLPLWQPDGIKEVEQENGRPLVLICEDDTDVAACLQMQLEQEGYSSDIAYSAEAAWLQLAKRNYDLMTLDLMLPGQDGLSFLHQIRSEKRTRDLPVVVISAVADKEKDELEGDALSLVDWIEKPVEQERLQKALLRAVRSATTGKPSVLHVEDDPDVAQVIDALLSEIADIHAAEDLATAKEKLSKQNFDLVILDIGLPDGSGLDLLPLLTHREPSVPAIIFSARDVDQELAENVTATLVKSRTSNQKLLSTIKRFIKQRQKHETDVNERVTP